MALTDLKNTVVARFSERFGTRPAAIGIAPGRVEVLGNHTDYNEGFILSAAIDRYIVLAGRARTDTTARIWCARFNEGTEFDVNDLQRDAKAHWADYIKGTLAECRTAGIPVTGFDAVLFGDVPLGSGLSSSAALEVATAQLMLSLANREIPNKELALLCQRAENKFVGVPCGILDQWSSIHGVENGLITLDCRTLTGGGANLGAGVELVLANTNAPHKLADGAYAKLRAACFEAASALRKHKPSITHLRDVSVAEFQQWQGDLPVDVRRRAKHVVTENDRVQRGIAALAKGDLATMGRCMCESHASSRDDFGNSCRELDIMVDLAMQLPGCHGCRLSGGGFGGCTVNLVDASKAEAFAETLAARYEEKTGIKAGMHLCRAVAGAHRVTA